MNNEPVAWRIKNPQMFNEWIVFPNKEQASLYAFHNGKGNSPEPLYTHPAKTEDEPNWKEMYWEMHDLNHKHWSALKAHPTKTLTDEEILKTCIKFGFYDRISDPHFDEKTGAWSLDEDLIEFARAILRKAQEK